MNITPTAPRKLFNQYPLIPILILILGLGVALLVSVVLMRLLMSASSVEIVYMVSELSTYSIGSLAFGFVVYYFIERKSPYLSLTLTFACALAAALCLFNVWIMARLMFFNAHDFTLTSVLLVFVAIIATAFGISATTRVARDLRALSHTAEQVAAGDLTARAVVAGRDEVSRVANSFNAMAEQLQAAERQREELEKMRRDLIAWTSHDLRTPLTSIRTMIEALHDGVVTDEETVKRYYRTIRADIVALNDLLDDLFELAQLDAGGLELEMQPHSLSDLISDTLETFHAVARRQGIALRGDVAQNLDPVVLNASKIGRVLGNLISNALRHTPAGGQVVVEAVRTPAGVRVTVRDSGPGFKPQDLARIFERFYRGEEARSRATGGAGLGLAIASGIVAAHDGRIWAENAAGGGAVVAFELPDRANAER